MPPKPTTYQLSGRIYDQHNQPVAGVTVKAFDQDSFAKTNPLGKAVTTDAKGNYRIPFSTKDYKRSSKEKDGPDVFIRVFLNEEQVGESKVKRNAKNKIKIDLQVVIKKEKPVQKSRVYGLVTDGEGTPVENVLVKAFDRDMRRSQELGKDLTKQGHFEIFYSPEDFDKAEKGTADLVVAAYYKEDKPLAMSEIYFNAPADQEINLTLPKSEAIKTEWEILEADIRPLLEGQNIVDESIAYGNVLPEDLDSKDFDFIHRDTGHEVSRVRLWSLAYLRAQQADGINAEVFYGWFRMDMPPELKPLFEKRIDQLLGALKQAGDQHIIGIGDEHWFINIQRQIESRKAQSILSPSPKGMPASLGDKLRAFGNDWLSNEHLHKIALHGPLDPDAKEFHETLKKLELPESAYKKLEQNIRLDKLTGGNVKLMKPLFDKVAEDDKGTLKSLAHVTHGEWLSLAYQHDVPVGDDKTKEAYAQELEAQVEKLHPTETLKIKLASKEIFSYRDDHKRLADAITLDPEFDIQKSDVKSFVEKNDLNTNQGMLLQKFQNLNKVGVTWVDTEVYIQAGVDSVEHIANHNEEQLSQSLSAVAVSLPSTLTGIIQKATNLEVRNVWISTFLPGLVQKATTGGTPTSPPFTPGPEPTIRNLFGPLEQCECDPCLSVLSPAAYYVDLLKFIDAGAAAEKELEKRRPDLYDLEISCENATIELPHIDLVLELLENAVVFRRQMEVIPGVNFDIELNSIPIGQHIIKLLQETAEETIGPLQLELTSLNGSIRTTIIKDAYRRWIIESSASFFGSTRDLSLGIGIMTASENDYNDLLGWLNGEPNFPNASKLHFDELLKRHAKTQLVNELPFWIDKYDSKRTSDENRWEITFNIRFNMRFTSPGIVFINEKDGIKLPKTYSKQFIGEIQRERGTLDMFKMLGMIYSYLGSNFLIDVTDVGPDEWSVKLTFSFDLFYRKGYFEIVGLGYQSTARDRDLLSRPQNRNPLAYEELSKSTSVFPWSLPYDHQLTEARLLLSKAGISLRTLLESKYSRSEAFKRDDWADEVLGLSPGSRGIISNPPPTPDTFRDWGLTPDGSAYKVFDTFTDKETFGSGLQLLSTASVVMQQARISFAELQALIDSRYINSGNPRVEIARNSNCQPNLTMLNNTTPEFFDRMHRFIRLWRYTKLSVAQLTEIILSPNLGNGVLDSTCLKALAQVTYFSESHSVPLRIAIGLFAPFNDNPEVSFTKNGKRFEAPGLYDSVFQNKLLQNPPDINLSYSKFIVSSPLDPPTNPKNLAELLASIALNLGESVLNLEMLVRANLPDLRPAGSSPTHFDLLSVATNIKSVEAIWRHITLSRIMKISLHEYIHSVQLISTGDPFNSPLDLLRFVDDVRLVQTMGMTISDLTYLLKPGNELDILNELDSEELINQITTRLEPGDDLIIRDLDLVKFGRDELAIPATDLERWNKWGLSIFNSGPEYTVPNPSGSGVLRELPLDLLKYASVLAQQCGVILKTPCDLKRLNVILSSINEIMDTPGALSLTTGSISPQINGLEIIHLDILHTIVVILSKSKLDVTNLGKTLKSVLGKIESAKQIDSEKLQNVCATIRKKNDEIIQLLSTKLALETSVIIDYLTNKVSASQTALPAMDNLNSLNFWAGSDSSAVLVKLAKLAKLNTYWKATPRQLGWLGKGSAFEWQGIDPNLLFVGVSFSDWKKTTLLFDSTNSLPDIEATVSRYTETIGAATNWADVRKARTLLSNYFAVKGEEVDAGALVHRMSEPSLPLLAAAQKNPENFAGLINYLKTLKKWSLKSIELEAITTASPTRAIIARQLVNIQYGHNYSSALREVNDPLRSIQRDRLVDYLCWRDKLKNADALYLHYLIDVQMEPRMRTTRLLQSTAAVQLFVNRCFMNLERGVASNTLDRPRWEWTRNYRVWEANRKVFLYPENWLFPELRDDRTYSFRTFESKLLQSESSDGNAINALVEYVEDIAALSKVIVMGMHEYEEVIGFQKDKITGREVEIKSTKLFQVGRTLNVPYLYYWRESTSVNGGIAKWTGWEKIDQDLPISHCIPFSFSGGLFIGYPTINVIKEDRDQNYDIEFNWIRKTSKGWSERRKSRNKASIRLLENRDEKTMFLLQLDETKVSPTIDLFAAIPPSLPNLGASDLRAEWVRDIGVVAGTKNNVEIYLSIDIKNRYNTGRVEPADAMIYVYGAIGNNILNLQKGVHTNLSEPFSYRTSFHKIVVSGWKCTESNGVWDRNPSWLEIHVCENKDAGYSGKTQIYAAAGNEYRVTGTVYIEKGQDLQSEITSEDQQVDIKRQWSFELREEEDGIWQDLRKEKSPIVIPKPFNALFFSSGILEIAPPNPQIKGISLLTSGSLFSSSGQGRFFCVKSSKSGELRNNSLRKWHIEENGNKILVNFNEQTTQLQEFVVPSGYKEAGQLKLLSKSDHKKVFEEHRTNHFRSNAFGIDRLLPDYGYTFNLPAERQSKFPFEYDKPNAIYNWEVFFHLPIAIAKFFSDQQRFEDARKWFHFIFDPTSLIPSTNSSNLPKASDAWRFLPFRNQSYQSIQKLLRDLADPNGDPTVKVQVEGQIKTWEADPFNPFAIARLRITPFAWFTIVQYIKNLIAWGDQLFRRDTRESINEATRLYVMASDMLGRRPEPMGTSHGNTPSKSYRALTTSSSKLDSFSNSWISSSPVSTTLASTQIAHQLGTIGHTYFCVPPNEKLPELWDTVADRLFKIRHSQNFEGVVRDLPLLDPPIDPELLIRARAAGISIPDVIANLYAPPGQYRFPVVLQKAMDLVNELKALGGAILSAIEKKEAERLSLLRSGQEIEMLKLVEQVKEEQINEARANIESLKKSRANIIARIAYLQKQLGSKELKVDSAGIPVMDGNYIAQVQEGTAPGDFQSLALTKSEVDQVLFAETSNVMNQIGGGFHTAAGLSHMAAAIAAPLESTIPTVPPAIPWHKIWTSTAHASSATGTLFNTLASHYSMLEKRSGMMAGWQRRHDEWLFQAKSAIAELHQLDKQIIASEIRIAITEKELQNHKTQIEHTQRLDDYVRNQKFTKETLYQWMEAQLSSVYFSTYQFALDQAQKAERAFKFELGVEEGPIYIRPATWDSLKKGLLSGELLANDLRRLEKAYLEKNQREFEITKHISLALLDPFALLQLRTKGSCDFEIPEVLFDMDFPGHYFRRIKSISLSIPCVAGPHTSISSTFTLLSNKVRTKRRIEGNRYTASENFSTSYIPVSKSITTSNAQNDSGVFELNFRDERYLPFEGAGVISLWRLELPKEVKQFDYSTISDVVVHIKYTARKEAGLVGKAEENLKETVSQVNQLANEKGLSVMFSMRHDMPNEWALVKNGNEVDIKIDEFRLPYFARFVAKTNQFKSIRFITSGAEDLGVKINTTEPPHAFKSFTELAANAFVADVDDIGSSFKMKVVSKLNDLSPRTPVISNASVLLTKIKELEDLVLIIELMKS